MPLGEPHVVERPGPGLPDLRRGRLGEGRDPALEGGTHLGARAPGSLGLQVPLHPAAGSCRRSRRDPGTGSRQASTASDQAAPVGARGTARQVGEGGSRRGATRPERAPASMAMLQSAMRPSMESAAIASPWNSRTCPVAPAGTDAGDEGQGQVLGAHAGGPGASRFDQEGPALRLGQGLGWPGRAPPRWSRCRRRAPRRRRGVLVWLSPQTRVDPGRVKPSSGPMMCTMPCRGSERGDVGDAEGAAVGLEGLHLRPGGWRPRCLCAGSPWARCGPPRPGCGPGRRTVRPVRPSPSKAWGLVTSWTRWRFDGQEGRFRRPALLDDIGHPRACRTGVLGVMREPWREP